MIRGLRIFFLLMLTQCGITSLYAQTKINSCLYIGEKDKYILSEKIKLDDRQTQTFNSLFIWDKDKVIRIMFLYDKKLPLLSKQATARLKSFESFLPTFKEVTWHDKIKKGMVYSSIYTYNETFTDKGKDEIGGRDYADKLKTLINAQNKIHNPLADKFGSINVKDGDPEVMIYNEKRKGKEINNLPLLINSANGDSSYIISPIHIDIYRVDNSKTSDKNILKNFTAYELYSTVSFLEQSIKYSTGENIEENYKWQGRFVEENTLQYLYRHNSPIDTISLMNELLELPLSDKKTYYSNIKVIEPQLVNDRVLTKKDSIRLIEYSNNRRKDSIRWREAVKFQFLKGNNFDYQYCAECYNEETSKNDKIKRHCPLKIALYKSGYNDNWSYAFSDKYRLYFKIEQRKYGGPYGNQDNNDQLNSYKWQLISPGIGYWMSDVSNYYTDYSTNFNGLFLNGRKISE